MTTYYSRNKEKVKESNRKWASENRERMNELARNHYHELGGKEYQAEYRKNNRDKYRDANKKWRENNADKEKERQRKYREENREKERERKAKYRAEQKLKYGVPDRFGGKTQALLRGILEEILRESVEEEKSFEWCKSQKGYYMRVDIFFPTLNLIVEYNGPQHYKPVKFGGTRLESCLKYRAQRKRDEFKYQLIKEHGYTLLIVPYWESVTKRNITKLLKGVMPL
jgi:hypothetical protein